MFYPWMSGCTKEGVRTINDSLERMANVNGKFLTAWMEESKAAQLYFSGLFRYASTFFNPVPLALSTLSTVERNKGDFSDPLSRAADFTSLLLSNLEMSQRALLGGYRAMSAHRLTRFENLLASLRATLLGEEGAGIDEFMEAEARIMEHVVVGYPAAIQDIKDHYGFHFDDGGYELVAETGRFLLYQVLPTDPGVEVNTGGKPMVIIPPYVLGPHILAFLPGEHRSFVHCFANHGIPTYVRIVKDIDVTPAVQTMTGEDDALDTKLFCQTVKDRHGRAATLCGYCQGGYFAVIDYLSGELDGVVDALITCVAPMDGTQSESLKGFLDKFPKRYQSLDYAIKKLPNGNEVVDGKMMSWVYKLASIEDENPISSFFSDLSLLSKDGAPARISKTAAAINYWLLFDQRDLPVETTRLSFQSYTVPVTDDGELPVTLFGRKLNFKRIGEKKVPWMICVAERDNLVEEEAALAPLKYVRAEKAVFPKGHAAIATSWSMPTSECSLQACLFGGGKYRGPVAFHLDIEHMMDRAR